VPEMWNDYVTTRIVLDAPGYDLRTFECPHCDHVELQVVKFAH
jgi:hypothetical protein